MTSPRVTPAPDAFGVFSLFVNALLLGWAAALTAQRISALHTVVHLVTEPPSGPT